MSCFLELSFNSSILLLCAPFSVNLSFEFSVMRERPILGFLQIALVCGKKNDRPRFCFGSDDH